MLLYKQNIMYYKILNNNISWLWVWGENDMNVYVYTHPYIYIYRLSESLKNEAYFGTDYV